jgi:osomolarity two-component system, phosphorelay intermediate protein YPD1
MDEEEDGDKEFSKGIVYGFLEQAEQTFDKMDTSLYRVPVFISHRRWHHISRQKNLPELSSLGHFLKGSSATLGFVKIKDQCERIQHFGLKKDESGANDIQDEEYCLRMISEALAEVKKNYSEVEALMRQYYGGGGDWTDVDSSTLWTSGELLTNRIISRSNQRCWWRFWR